MASRTKQLTNGELSKTSLSRKEIKSDVNEVYDYVQLKQLPKFTELSEKVNRLVKESSWWELHGVDWVIHLLAVAGAVSSYWIMSLDSVAMLVLGAALLGYCHTVLSVKGGHAAAHGAICKDKSWDKLWQTFFTEIVGSFSADAGYEIHILSHHPDTNIVGLGDSSTWRVPGVPGWLYMTVGPLLLPLITPLVAVQLLWGRWLRLAKSLFFISLGLGVNLYLLTHVSGMSLGKAVFCTFAARAILATPYIHVNIFQHIGLPMYSQENRPKRIYQMSTGVLNLPRNLVLDYAFGHSIISCHVEHHLFAKLSDNMCLKVKPLVRQFLLESGLPYNEAPYLERFNFFLSRYPELMQLAPPITHFVGVQ